MWHNMNNRPIARRAFHGVLGGFFLVAVLGFGQPRARADSVDDLRQTLSLRLEELGNPTQTILDNRRTLLQKKIESLRTIGELRRALTLEEWKDNATVVNKKLSEIDAEMRRQVGQRLTKRIQELVRKGDTVSRLALANSIAEMGPTIRSIDNDRTGYARMLTPEVILLAKDTDQAVREQALRALGNIFPKAQQAAPVFKGVLQSGTPGLQRLAAEGLGQLVRVVNHLEKRGRTATGVEASRGDVLETLVEVLGANHVGLQNPDTQVRALCLQNVQLAAEALANVIPDGFPQKEFPPEGRELTKTERGYITDLHELVQRDLKDSVPVLEALRAQASAVARSLEDADSTVRLAALEALENVGNARLRIRKRVLSVPLVPGADPDGDLGNRKLLAANDALEEFVARNVDAITRILADASVAMRRKGVEMLDILEDAATPALPALALSLGDPDRFVRWSAARAIANIAPAKAAVAVPGLAKLLSDPDLSVRMEAAKTLKEMGSAAYLAVPALGQAATIGDVEGRVAAMEALQNISADKAQAAVPQLVEALDFVDARVRRSAARTLGGIGAHAAAAIPALRQALGDEDQEVRVNAGDAILSIQQP